MSTLVACPHCKTSIEWSTENEFRPFCSERCKLQDLGAWFLEERSIKGENALGVDGLDISDLPADMQAEIKDLLN